MVFVVESQLMFSSQLSLLPRVRCLEADVAEQAWPRKEHQWTTGVHKIDKGLPPTCVHEQTSATTFHQPYDFTDSVVCGTIIFDMGTITKKAHILETNKYGGSMDVSIEASKSYANLRVNDCIRTIVTNLR